MGWIFITKFSNLSLISCYICRDININWVGFFFSLRNFKVSCVSCLARHRNAPSKYAEQ